MVLGKEKYDDSLSFPLYEFLEKNDFYIAIGASIIAAVFALISTYLIKRINK